MKNFQQSFKRRAGIIGMMCLLGALFSACVKDKNSYILPPAAQVSVIDASPGSKPLDFYLDRNRVNSISLKYGDVLDYVRAYPGIRYAGFYLSGYNTKVKADSVTLQVNKFYSVFLANVPGKEDLVLLTDSISQPPSGMASIRFVNLSPDAGPVDFAIKGGSVLAANKAYKQSSAFLSIEGAKRDTIEILKTGTSTVLASIPAVDVHYNSIYTVWLQGLAAATDDTKLSGKVQLNVYYNN